MPDADRVENRQGIGGMEREVVAPLGPVAGARPSRVVRDHGGVRLERGDLMPDDARIDDVPGRQEEDGPLAAAVPVPGDPCSIGARRHALLPAARRGDHGAMV